MASPCMEERLAIDTTLVSPLARDGSVKRGADRTDGAVCGSQKAERGTHPELAGVVAGPSLSSSLLRLAVAGPRSLDSS